MENKSNTMGTIYILWLRQLKRYFRSRARMAGFLGQPLLFLLALGFGLGPIFERAGDGNYIQFLAPGVITMGILFTAIFSGMEVIWDRQFGFLKETMVAPVSRVNIMIGRTLGGATAALVQGVVVLLLAVLVGFRPDLTLLPLTLLAMALVATLFTALGTAIASVLNDMQGFPLIINFLVMPLFFLSGALFPLEGLPKALQITATIDPVTYGVDAIRGTLIGASHFGLPLDFAVLGLITAILMALGSYLFSKIQV